MNRKRALRVLVSVVLAMVLAHVASAAPADYGKVVINNGSQKAGLAPVVFDHWLHRAKYTCRLCHVDIGFGMKAGSDVITAADNAKGLYCGVCHNGKTVFAACTADKSDVKRCERCHSEGKAVQRTVDFATFTAKLPKDKFGNGVNWEKAAEDGTIKLSDFIEGVSLKKSVQTAQKDFTIKPKSAGMAEIIFSHKKHSAWNGCEVCHPEIFPRTEAGAARFTMFQIADGESCGVCHGKVAFALAYCNKCHVKPVRFP
jgi:c(7)-type cytochrome triheme protein